MAADYANVVLNVLVRRDGEVVELDLAGKPATPAAFCRLIRGSAAGLQRCKTCRSLVAFGACCRGLTEHTCHGGVAVLAAPAARADGGVSDSVVVTSCAFAHDDGVRGWRRAREHARGLPVDLRTLRQAYRRLPTVGRDRLPLAGAIVEVAAAALGEIERLLESRRCPEAVRPPVARRVGEADATSGEVAAALALSRDPSFQRAGQPTGATLAGLVQAMVERDPGMPFTVARIARAARMTPNHFSTLFHQQTGRTFTEFLTARRIELAKRLLQDVTLSIKEVSHRAGFADAAYFARRVRQVTGTTPSRWRRARGSLTSSAAGSGP
jgi:AraC-like DNA-binding protein